MDALFIKILNMSITASILALAVMLIRLVFRKMPKNINVFLWALVALRLILPFSIQSPASLLPENEPVREEYFGLSSPASPAAEPDEWTTVGVIGEYDDVYPTVPVQSDGTKTGTEAFPVLPAVWLGGVGAMLLYAAVSYLKIRKQTSASVEKENGVYICDEIETPFILGIVKPKIYIPSALNEEHRAFVLRHEKTHIRRLDFLWKPLGFALLAVYWFNPVLWLAFVLLCRDIELACDEKVIENMGIAERADYSQTLLDCSAPKRGVAACPLAFGETGVKQRVKNILNHKKPAFWIMLAAVLVCAALAVFFLTDPVKNKNDAEPTTNGYIAREYDSEDLDTPPEPKSTLEEAIHEALIKRSWSSYRGECLTEGHITLGTEEKYGRLRAYLLTNICSYGFQNGYFTDVGGSSVPTVLVFREEDGMYVFDKCLEAEDGGLYADSIRDLFPLRFRSRVLNTWSEADHKSMIDQCNRQAQAYLDAIGRTEEIRSWGDVPHRLLTDVGISVEIQEKIFGAMDYIPHYDYLGYEECVENGVRYIYRTEYDKGLNKVTFTQENSENGALLYIYGFFADTGEKWVPNNVTFAENVDTEQIHKEDSVIIASGVFEKLNDYPRAGDERWYAVIKKADMVPLGMAGLIDGIGVYDVTYTAMKYEYKGEGGPANDNAIGKEEFSGYFFVFYNDFKRTFAGAMTMDEIRARYGSADNSGSDEELLMSAAGELINNCRASAFQAVVTDPVYGTVEIVKGVEVYVWKMSKDDYRFDVLPGTNREKTPEELMALEGHTAEEMKEILQKYNYSPDEIFIHQNYYSVSSYYWSLDDPEYSDGDTEDSIREMLGLN